MLQAQVVVSSRILKDGKFPVREYEQPQSGFSKFLYCIQYYTPSSMNRAKSAESEEPYDYE